MEAVMSERPCWTAAVRPAAGAEQWCSVEGGGGGGGETGCCLVPIKGATGGAGVTGRQLDQRRVQTSEVQTAARKARKLTLAHVRVMYEPKRCVCHSNMAACSATRSRTNCAGEQSATDILQEVMGRWWWCKCLYVCVCVEVGRGVRKGGGCYIIWTSAVPRTPPAPQTWTHFSLASARWQFASNCTCEQPTTVDSVWCTWSLYANIHRHTCARTHTHTHTRIHTKRH